MKIGLIGLGKMGYQLALNMQEHTIDVIAHDTSELAMTNIQKENINVAHSIKELIEKLSPPRIIWLMVPAGKIVETLMDSLSDQLSTGDILIDGGNSNFNDTARRYHKLKEKQIHLVDCGTSGGTEGARNGACLMVGGDARIVSTLHPLFNAIAEKNGYAHVGEAGSGHYVKMIHNGIEYGMMQAIGEGFDLLHASDYTLDYEQIAKVWAHGSIIRGLLIENIHSALQKDAHLDLIEGRVDDSGEGQWTVEEALRKKVSIPVITQSMFARYKSKDNLKFSEKVVAAMRNEFGGHAVYKKK